MKKTLSVMLAVALFVSLCTLTVHTTTAVPGGVPYTDKPDWIITEIAPDQIGDGTGGWSDGCDTMEFLELYNNSGSTLNLYDYAMTYNGSARSSARFEVEIIEYTPFNADWYDGSYGPDNTWTYTEAGFCGNANLPTNPQTFMVAPEETIVVWFYYCESTYDRWNNGKGLSIQDFREFWNIDEKVRVAIIDGNSQSNRNGNDKNFNLKNNETGTYGICLKSDAINKDANTQATATYFYASSHHDCVEMEFWAILDYTNQTGGSTQANLTFNFIPDIQGYGSDEWGYVRDSRRGLFAESFAEATPGKLTTIQKLALGVALEAGESLDIGYLYYPIIDALGDFEGLIIDGVLYGTNATFTAEKAGIATLQYKYSKDNLTYTNTVGVEQTTPAETTTKAPAETTTAKPVITTASPVTATTAAPLDAATTATPVGTTASPADGKNGCGTAVLSTVIICVIPYAGLFIKKQKE